MYFTSIQIMCYIVLYFLQGNSVVSSNSNLAVYGQGLLSLTGQGDVIEAQRLSLSLFYNVTVRYHQIVYVSKVVFFMLFNTFILCVRPTSLSIKAFCTIQLPIHYIIL